MEEWTSPDDRIHKKVLLPGNFGLKPYQESRIKLNIIECPEAFNAFNNKALIVGDNDGDLGRALDICICTMHLKERAKFTITLDLEQISIIMELVELNFEGFIYQWNAKKKMEIALKHKEKGTIFFNNKNEIEAAYRFIKALKIICSIPLAVENTLELVEEVKVADIKALKEKLYNNLSSCYFRKKVYNMVIPLCDKVLALNTSNIKALYKIGVAYEDDKNFEKANAALAKVMELEPQNKACSQHLANVKENLRQADIRVNDLMKKIIGGVITK